MHKIGLKFTGIANYEDHKNLDPLKDGVGKGPTKSKWINLGGFDAQFSTHRKNHS